jgi:DnaJ-class molecular chaperone
MGAMDTAGAYEVLGVGPDDAWADVRSNYLRLVREHHPDTAVDDADAGIRTVRTAQITEAYSTLLANREPSRAVPSGVGTRGVCESFEGVVAGSRRGLGGAELCDT